MHRTQFKYSDYECIQHMCFSIGECGVFYTFSSDYSQYKNEQKLKLFQHKNRTKKRTK